MRLPRVGRRAAGRTMIGIAVFGFVTAIVGTVFAWQAAGRLEDTLDESLEVTVEALDVVAETVALADAIVGVVSDTVATTEASMGDVTATFETATGLFTELSAVTDSLPGQLEVIERGIGRVAAVADTIDEVLAVIDEIPLAPDVPPVELGAAVEQVLEGLRPVADDLGGMSEDLAVAAANAEALQDDLDALEADLAASSETLATADALVDDFSTSANRARLLAIDARSDIGEDVSALRILTVLMGAAIALGQFVPLWIGLQLLRGPLTVTDRSVEPLSP